MTTFKERTVKSTYLELSMEAPVNIADMNKMIAMMRSKMEDRGGGGRMDTDDLFQIIPRDDEIVLRGWLNTVEE